MHIRRGALNWGVFLILAGAVPLAVRAGYLTDEQVTRLWSLWPLVLVGIGVGLILSRTNFNFLGGLVIAATFGLMVGGLLSGGVNGFPTSACGSDSGGVAFPARNGSIVGTSGTVDLRLDCGDLDLAVTTGTAWVVEGKDARGTGPNLTSSDSSLRVASNEHDANIFGPFSTREDWKVTLPDGPNLDLSVRLNAGSANADLGNATLGQVSLEMNAGSTTLDLGTTRAIEGFDANLNAGSLSLSLPNVSFDGSIRANAGSVKMCAPAGVALRLHTDGSNLASFDYSGQGLVQEGATWTTPGFESAAVKIDLRTQANAGSFSLNPEDGCE
jgi:hypothetical protein